MPSARDRCRCVIIAKSRFTPTAKVQIQVRPGATPRLSRRSAWMVPSSKPLPYQLYALNKYGPKMLRKPAQIPNCSDAARACAVIGKIKHRRLPPKRVAGAPQILPTQCDLRARMYRPPLIIVVVMKALVAYRRDWCSCLSCARPRWQTPLHRLKAGGVNRAGVEVVNEICPAPDMAVVQNRHIASPRRRRSRYWPCRCRSDHAGGIAEHGAVLEIVGVAHGVPLAPRVRAMN